MNREDIMNSYAENLRRSIVNTTRRFKHMTDELKAKQDAADREEIVRMAREAGPLISTPFDVWCERFASLVAAAEREACAQVCDELERANLYGVKECAAAIRKQGEQE